MLKEDSDATIVIGMLKRSLAIMDCLENLRILFFHPLKNKLYYCRIFIDETNSFKNIPLPTNLPADIYGKRTDGFIHR